MTRVLVGVDAPVVRAGLQQLLDADSSITVVGWAATPLTVAEQVEATKPRVVLLWFNTLQMSADVARALPGVPVVAVGQIRREQDVIDALTAGVRGLLERQCSVHALVTTVTEVAGGQLAYPSGWERALVARLERMQAVAPRVAPDVLRLTARETDILKLLLEGYSVKQVANRLGIALQTTKNHIHHIMVKTNSSSRVELVTWAMGHGFRPPTPTGGAENGDERSRTAGHVLDAQARQDGGRISAPGTA